MWGLELGLSGAGPGGRMAELRSPARQSRCTTFAGGGWVTHTEFYGPRSWMVTATSLGSQRDMTERLTHTHTHTTSLKDVCANYPLKKSMRKGIKRSLHN